MDLLNTFECFMERAVDLLPREVHPYVRLMRLDKPTGTQFLIWPCFWSIAMASSASGLPPLSTLIITGIGLTLMRSAGCVINDIFDKDFDKRVERTKSRPLAANQLNTANAVILFVGLLVCGSVLLLQFDNKTIVIGFSSLLFLFTYPFHKRFTYWPQLMLGVTFNWGVLIGWSAVTNGLVNWSAVLPLYVSGIFWTLIYDTIYAHQDVKDDLKIGLKSTAIKFGENTHRFLTFFSIMMCSTLVLTGINTYQLWPYYTSLIFIAINLWHQISTLNIKDRNDCWLKFRQNTKIGWILFVGIVLSTYLKEKQI